MIAALSQTYSRFNLKPFRHSLIAPATSVRKPRYNHNSFSQIDRTAATSRDPLTFDTSKQLRMAAVASRKRKVAEPKRQPQKRTRRSETQNMIEDEEKENTFHGIVSRPTGRESTSDNKAKIEEHGIVKHEDVSKDLKNVPQFQAEPSEGEAQTSTRRTLRPRRSAVKLSYAESEEDAPQEKKPARASTKRTSAQKRAKKEESTEDDAEPVLEKTPRKPTKKTKDNPYGLTPGITPFPDWEGPSAANCEDVYQRLSKIHGAMKAPEKIPAPSLEVSGCGEVPSVLDALVRTRLSANTSNSNSSAAFRGLVNKFGVLKDGIGKGSVDWNNVRQAPLTTLVEAIKCGGLAQIKGKDIKTILEMVYQENTKRREAFLAEKKSGKTAEVMGAGGKTQGQKDLEILKVDDNVLSLDHIHGMEPDEAMLELIKFPGIGVKTASCVILFCLQQPSFAVDTHVHRLSRWLGWIPPNATRDQAFSHLEVRIPNHLKYGLHKQFVLHGRTCLKCRANTSEGTEEYNNADCPLDGIIDRVGKRKSSGKSSGSKKKALKDEDSD